MSSAADQRRETGEADSTPWWESPESLPMLTGPEPQADAEAPPVETPPAQSDAAPSEGTEPSEGTAPSNDTVPLPEPEPAADGGMVATGFGAGEVLASGPAPAGPVLQHPGRPEVRRDAPRPVPRAANVGAPGLKHRGIFVIQFIFATLGCVLGFLLSGTTSIPALAGWGLIVGSAASALLSPARLGWTAAWMPPLSMTAVVVVWGQLTFLGAMPTLAREAGMIAAGLTAVAPAQLISVVVAGAILAVKRRAGRAHSASAAGQP